MTKLRSGSIGLLRFCTIAMFGILLAGCMSTRQPETLKIGTMLPLTGEYSVYGRALHDGMLLALTEINSQPDAMPIELVVRDTAGNPRLALEEYARFAEEGVPVVIAGGATLEVLRLQRAVETHQVPLLLPIATADVLTRKNDKIVRTCFTDADQSRALAVHMRENLKLDTLAVMLDLQNEGAYGRNLANNVSRAFKELGGKVVRTEGFRNEDLYFTPQLDAIMAKNPQAIFVPALPETAARIIREARLRGYNGWFIGGDSLADPAFLDTLTVDSGAVAYTAMFDPHLESAREFSEKFNARFHHQPNDCAAQGYDTLRLAASVLRAGAPEAFFERWLQQSQVQFLSGATTMDANGDAVRPILFVEVRVKPDGTLDSIVTIPNQ